MCPGVGPEAGLRWSAHPSGGVECRGHAQYPAFAPNAWFLLPALQKWQLGFLVFVYLLSRICPNCACTQLFLVPYSVFVFCSLRRYLSRCKHCSKGSQVSGASLSQFLLVCCTHRQFHGQGLPWGGPRNRLNYGSRPTTNHFQLHGGSSLTMFQAMNHTHELTFTC